MAGHIEERGKDRHGRDVFRVFVSGGFDGNGKRIRKTITVHGTRREAERALKQTERELEDGTTSSTMKFADWVHQWLKATDRSRAPRTVAEYARMLASLILPALGGYRLDQIKPRQIAEFMAKLAGATHAKRKGCNLTGNTQLKYFRLISVIFQNAVYLGMLPSNPARQVRPPRHERRSARFYEPQDVSHLWESLQVEPLMWQAIIATCLLLGVRRGELMGLRWGDINWARGVIRIERAAYRVSREEQRVKAPKTATSVRAIIMPSPLVAIMRE